MNVDRYEPRLFDLDDGSSETAPLFEHVEHQAHDEPAPVELQGQLTAYADFARCSRHNSPGCWSCRNHPSQAEINRDAWEAEMGFCYICGKKNPNDCHPPGPETDRYEAAQLAKDI